MNRHSASNVEKASNGRLLEVLRQPIITEKATLISEYNQVTFEVAIDANKFEIKAAVEDLFKVKVVKVNTIVQQGKTKKFKGRPGRRSDYKKAIVTLAEGQSIDVSTGI